MIYKKILIVDDDQVDLKILRDAFNSNEYHILQASGGYEAINVAKNDHPNLIILDIMMPDMDGGRVASLLKSDPSTKDIPIIFLSSSIRKEEERFSSALDGIYLMAKPFDRESLLKKVSEYL